MDSKTIRWYTIIISIEHFESLKIFAEHMLKKIQSPDYNKIYADIIEKKFPDKKDKIAHFLSNEITTSLQVIQLNDYIFGSVDNDTLLYNQKHRSYDEKSIKNILLYQQQNQLNNTQISNQFKISRNTISKWKKEISI